MVDGRTLTEKSKEELIEIIEETLLECPDCYHTLGEPVGIEEQIQEDIIPAHVRTRKYRRHKYDCAYCGKEVLAPYHPEHVPLGYLGAEGSQGVAGIRF